MAELVPIHCRGCGHHALMHPADAADHPCPRCGRYGGVVRIREPKERRRPFAGGTIRGGVIRVREVGRG